MNPKPTSSMQYRMGYPPPPTTAKTPRDGRTGMQSKGQGSRETRPSNKQSTACTFIWFWTDFGKLGKQGGKVGKIEREGEQDWSQETHHVIVVQHGASRCNMERLAGGVG
uniref:Uncharacterized protein n=1 Tax=Eutreptiella gymnastica TaxID=73025 RepID=A0A7S1IE33_9EUGL|mmetsp:Transcript_149893/g.261850  ORF Transcript_149893/g.261850 Transcript_149893/m.261850 type:complete len:110 (+) Transcript_149893:223-552(+)